MDANVPQTAPTLVVPIVHMNGSSAKTLIANLEKAYVAVNDASKVLREIAPHARDYYVSPDPDLYNKARVQHDHRLLGLHAIMDSLVAELEGIQAQNPKRIL